MGNLPLIVMAGRPKVRDELLEHANVDNKVFIEFRGKKLIQIVLEAVAESSVASHVLIVGLERQSIDLPASLSVEHVHFLEIEGEHFDKIYKAAEFVVANPQIFGVVRHVLFTSGDLPFLRGEVIRRFYQSTAPRDADFYYSVVPKEAALEASSTFPWGYMTIKDGSFVSGNLGLINPNSLLERYDLIKFVSQNRKSFVWGVFKASPWMFLKLIFRLIKLEEAERLMTKFFDIESRVVVSPDYEHCLDLDQPEHLDYIRQLEMEKD